MSDSQIEPEALNIASNIAREYDGNDVVGIAAVSIAISLKRIADALSYQGAGENFYDLVNDLRHNTRGGP